MNEFRVTNTDGKVEFLLRERGIDIYKVKAILDAGNWLDVFKNPKKPKQYLYVIKLDDYCYLVPVVEKDRIIKTVYPSRQMTKRFLKKNKD